MLSPDGHMHKQTENWLSAHPLIMLYICTKFYASISNGFRVTDLKSRVNARVAANVDNGQTEGHTDTRMNGWKTGSLYRAMPKAGVTTKSQDHEI